MNRVGTHKNKRRRTVVPAQFLGYSLQELRVAVHLFAAGDEDVVALEVAGDTSIHSPDGNVITEEHKSRLSSANPIADTAEGLWKTFRNWVEAVSRGELDPQRTLFRLHISRPCESNIATRFSESTSVNAEAAIAFARERVWLSADDEPLVGALPEATRPHVAALFDMDLNVFKAVVSNFRLDFGRANAWADLRHAAQPAAIEPDCLEAVLQNAVGWVKQEITAAIEQGRPAAVGASAFRANLRAVQRRLDRRTMLVCTAPNPAAIDEQLRSVQKYLRQLELIEAPDDMKLDAVTDYLRASNARVEWGLKGWVHQDSFDDFERELTSAWRRNRARTELDYRGELAEDRGMRLYLSCCDHSAHLPGLHTPPEFCRGSFHALADNTIIGWHPHYNGLLRSPVSPKTVSGGEHEENNR